MCFSNPANPTDEALEEYLGPLVSSPERKALINRYALGLFPNPLAGIADQLRECKLPVRIVWGMGDTIFSPKSPDYLASLMPQATIRRLDKAKLFWPEEYPDIIVEEARKLWRAA
jgi:pimeloyl-ACP methyl ester carboxylesterase